MNKNTLKFGELMILLTWIKGKQENNRVLNLEVIEFPWEDIFRNSLAMDMAGLSSNSAGLNDIEFENIFKQSLAVFKDTNFEDVEFKLKNFNDKDLVSEVNDKLGKKVNVTNEMIENELNKLYKYQEIVENIFLTYSFSDIDLIDSQLKFINKELKILILNELYEECVPLQEKLNEIQKQ